MSVSYMKVVFVDINLEVNFDLYHGIEVSK